MHLSKAKRTDIVDSFKDLYHDYWANQQGDLVMVPAIDTAELMINIFSYTHHLATMAKAVQKTSNENSWSLVQTHTNVKACVDNIANFKKQLSKKTPGSEELLTPQLYQA